MHNGINAYSFCSVCRGPVVKRNIDGKVNCKFCNLLKYCDASKGILL
jgi:hypothetical protein